MQIEMNPPSGMTHGTCCATCLCAYTTPWQVDCSGCAAGAGQMMNRRCACRCRRPSCHGRAPQDLQSSTSCVAAGSHCALQAAPCRGRVGQQSPSVASPPRAGLSGGLSHSPGNTLHASDPYHKMQFLDTLPYTPLWFCLQCRIAEALRALLQLLTVRRTAFCTSGKLATL